MKEEVSSCFLALSSLTLTEKDIQTVDAVLSELVDRLVFADQGENIPSQRFGFGVTSVKERELCQEDQFEMNVQRLERGDQPIS